MSACRAVGKRPAELRRCVSRAPLRRTRRSGADRLLHQRVVRREERSELVRPMRQREEGIGDEPRLLLDRLGLHSDVIRHVTECWDGKTGGSSVGHVGRAHTRRRSRSLTRSRSSARPRRGARRRYSSYSATRSARGRRGRRRPRRPGARTSGSCPTRSMGTCRRRTSGSGSSAVRARSG